jgi:ADP-dependent phosphofructokinase/glucokinase
MNNISLGFGDNTDYELIWDTDAIKLAIKEFNISNAEIKLKTIVDNERDLLIGMLYFLKNNIGGECSVYNTQVLKKFASRFKYNITIGGTGPRAAIAMKTLGYDSFLHLVVMNEDLEKLIPSSIKYICSNEDINYDIHLIFQYPKAVSIHVNDISINTTRENRIIIGNNDVNSIMKLSQEYFDKYVNISKVLMISGFNTMTDIPLLRSQLEFIAKNIKQLKDIKIYYEDACFMSEEANQLCKEMLFKYVDIFSFNEDELINYCGRNINLLDEKDVLRGIEELYKKFHVDTLVVHSKYWAIAYGDKTPSYKSCLKGGITMATTRFRFGDNFNNKEQYFETEILEDGEIETQFANKFNSLTKDKSICIPSVKVEETDVTTVGLGDSFVGGFVSKLSEL